MIFQDPFTMLNPVMRCSKHIEEVLRNRDDRKIGRAAAKAGGAPAARRGRHPRPGSGAIATRSSSREGCGSGSGSLPRLRATRSS